MSRDRELSISFSDDELAALNGCVGERAPVALSLDDPELAPKHRAPRREVALAALTERNIVRNGGAEVAAIIVPLIQILARPVIAISATAGEHEARWGLVEDTGVELVGNHDGWRITPFASRDSTARVASAAHLVRRAKPKGGPLAIRRADIAADHPILGRVEITRVEVQGRPVHGRMLGAQLAWLDSTAGYWRVEPSAVQPPDGAGSTPGWAVSTSAESFVAEPVASASLQRVLNDAITSL